MVKTDKSPIKCINFWLSISQYYQKDSVPRQPLQGFLFALFFHDILAIYSIKCFSKHFTSFLDNAVVQFI